MAIFFVGGVLGILILIYVLYKIFQFAKADADITLLSKFLKPDFFKGKVVWVTGASSGIGEELCRQLSVLGAKVILSARSKEKLESVSQTLSHPDDSRVLVLDMLDMDSFAEAVTQAKELFGRIDILVNNAGVASRCFFMDFEEKPARTLFDINFLNTVTLTKHVLDVMVRQKGGHIVNISSVSGKGGGTGRHYYGASKAALLSMMDSLRIDFIEDNIHFTNILPGPVKTNVTINAFTKDGSKFGKMDHLIRNGMKVDRCCSLILIAVSNGLREAWISTQPFLYLTYLAQYAPSWQFAEMVRLKKKIQGSTLAKKD